MDTPLTLTRPIGRSAAPRTPVHAPPAAPRRSDSDTELLRATVRSLAVAVLEALNGARAASTVARWITPELLEKIRTHAVLRQELARAVAPRVHTFSAGAPRICRITDGIVESAVVVRGPRRSRAVAMRLEQQRGRWVVTEFVSV